MKPISKNILILALSSLFVFQAGSSPENDKLKELVNKSRVEGASYNDVKALRDQLKATYPNTDQAAIGESVYMSYLSEVTRPTRSAEMKVIFDALKSNGESKWYVVSARLALISAYSQEGMEVEAKALAQEGLQKINVAELKESYNALIVILKDSVGTERFGNVDTDINSWMTVLHAIAEG